jgi:Glycosyltransferase family 87
MGAFTGSEAALAPDRHWLNAERVRVYSMLFLTIFGVMLAYWIGRSLPDLVDPSGKPFGYDFMAYWSAAKLALLGRPAAAFDEHAISVVQHMAVPSLPGIVFPWHYPSTFLLLVAPLGLLPYAAALALFVGAGATLWAGFLHRILPDRRAWIVAAAAPAGLINLLDGQNAFLTAGLAGFALLALNRRPVLAGIMIGLLAIKPQLGILFPVMLLAEHRWSTIAAAAATTLALCAASLMAFGWDSWAAFLHHLPLTQEMGESGAVPWRTMPTALVFALSLSAPDRVAWSLQTVIAAFAALCVWRAWRNPTAPFEAKAATLLAGSLLVSPYLFYYDLLWLALAVGWLAILALRDGFRRGEREVFLFAWLAPLLMPPVQMLTSVQIGFPAVLLVLLMALRRAAPLSGTERRYLRCAVDLLRHARWVTRERVMRCGVLCGLLAVAILIIDLAQQVTRGPAANGPGSVPDFIIFWTGAKLAAQGLAAQAYDATAYRAFVQGLLGPLADIKIYTYPPIAMLLSWPLALVPYGPAFVTWSLLGIVLCAAGLAVLTGWRAAMLAVVATPAAILDAIAGQNGHFTAALLGGGLVLLDRQPVLAGILFGLLSYKPQIGLLLPFALAAGGRWRVIAAAALTVGILLTASILLLGGESWAGYRSQTETWRMLMQVAGPFWQRTQTVFFAFHNAGASVTFAYVVQAISTILAGIATVLVWRSPSSHGIKAAVLLVATFLTTPYAWDYDMVVLIFAAAWLAREGSVTGFLPWERITVALLLVQPILTLILTPAIGVQLAPVGLWFAFVVLLRRGLRYLSVASSGLTASTAVAR